MLRVKQDKLQELEKFGFKKFYNCDTGQIDYYYKIYFEEAKCFAHGWEFLQYEIRCNAYKIELRKGNYFKKKTIKTNFSFDTPPNFTDRGFSSFVDTIYDLIKADIVEKVVEDE